MRITCPLCGDRDRREYQYAGSDDLLTRPGPDDASGWDDMLHNRTNPAGVTRDLWYHDMGCSAWLVVTRDTVTHAVHSVALVVDHARTSGTQTGRPDAGAPAGPTSGRRRPARPGTPPGTPPGLRPGGGVAS